jgi:hypothetical protein
LAINKNQNPIWRNKKAAAFFTDRSFSFVTAAVPQADRRETILSKTTKKQEGFIGYFSSL